MEKDYPNRDLNRPLTVLSTFYSDPLQIPFFSSNLSISRKKSGWKTCYRGLDAKAGRMGAPDPGEN
jgi:hypothetical protein